jgi:hypothetical protein
LNKPPLPSILLVANMQSLENKIDDLRGTLNYQQDIQNCSILCFTESWLNDDTINIQLAGYTLYREDRTAASGKTRSGGLCIFVNYSWCTISMEVSPEVDYIMISCRPLSRWHEWFGRQEQECVIEFFIIPKLRRAV